MKLHKLLFTALALVAFASGHAHAKRKAVKPQNTVPKDCKVMADSLQKLYDAGDPAYLTWSISPQCDSTQLYTAYYYQGLGFYVLSAWKESLYFLTLAKEIGGTKDEEILFHLWNVNRKLNRYQEMERATLELHRRYPNSYFLMEILDRWKAVKHPTQPWTFNYTSKVDFAKNDYLNNVFTNRLRAGTNQKKGDHRFRETGSIALKAKLPEVIPKSSSDTTPPDKFALQGFQANLGGEYEYKGLTVELNYGIGYESQNSSGPLLLISNGIKNQLVDSNWNWLQGRAALGYSLTTKDGWNLGWNLNALQLAKDWQAMGVSHTQSYLFTSWILLGYVDYQIHALKLDFSTGDSTLPSPIVLDRMQTFMANLTPYFSWDKHSAGIGATYYQSTTHYTNAASSMGLIKTNEIDHSFTATASYVYEPKKWVKFNLDTSYGWEFNQTQKYVATPLYGMATGISLSF